MAEPDRMISRRAIVVSISGLFFLATGASGGASVAVPGQCLVITTPLPTTDLNKNTAANATVQHCADQCLLAAVQADSIALGASQDGGSIFISCKCFSSSTLTTTAAAAGTCSTVCKADGNACGSVATATAFSVYPITSAAASGPGLTPGTADGATPAAVAAPVQAPAKGGVSGGVIAAVVILVVILGAAAIAVFVMRRRHRLAPMGEKAGGEIEMGNKTRGLDGGDDGWSSLPGADTGGKGTMGSIERAVLAVRSEPKQGSLERAVLGPKPSAPPIYVGMSLMPSAPAATSFSSENASLTRNQPFRTPEATVKSLRMQDVKKSDQGSQQKRSPLGAIFPKLDATVAPSAEPNRRPTRSAVPILQAPPRGKGGIRLPLEAPVRASSTFGNAPPRPQLATERSVSTLATLVSGATSTAMRQPSTKPDSEVRRQIISQMMVATAVPVAARMSSLPETRVARESAVGSRNSVRGQQQQQLKEMAPPARTVVTPPVSSNPRNVPTVFKPLKEVPTERENLQKQMAALRQSTGPRMPVVARSLVSNGFVTEARAESPVADKARQRSPVAEIAELRVSQREAPTLTRINVPRFTSQEQDGEWTLTRKPSIREPTLADNDSLTRSPRKATKSVRFDVPPPSVRQPRSVSVRQSSLPTNSSPTRRETTPVLPTVVNTVSSAVPAWMRKRAEERRSSQIVEEERVITASPVEESPRISYRVDTPRPTHSPLDSPRLEEAVDVPRAAEPAVKMTATQAMDDLIREMELMSYEDDQPLTTASGSSFVETAQRNLSSVTVSAPSVADSRRLTSMSNFYDDYMGEKDEDEEETEIIEMSQPRSLTQDELVLPTTESDPFDAAFSAEVPEETDDETSNGMLSESDVPEVEEFDFLEDEQDSEDDVLSLPSPEIVARDVPTVDVTSPFEEEVSEEAFDVLSSYSSDRESVVLSRDQNVAETVSSPFNEETTSFGGAFLDIKVEEPTMDFTSDELAFLSNLPPPPDAMEEEDEDETSKEQLISGATHANDNLPALGTPSPEEFDVSLDASLDDMRELAGITLDVASPVLPTIDRGAEVHAFVVEVELESASSAMLESASLAVPMTLTILKAEVQAHTMELQVENELTASLQSQSLQDAPIALMVLVDHVRAFEVELVLEEALGAVLENPSMAISLEMPVAVEVEEVPSISNRSLFAYEAADSDDEDLVSLRPISPVVDQRPLPRSIAIPSRESEAASSALFAAQIELPLSAALFSDSDATDSDDNIMRLEDDDVLPATQKRHSFLTFLSEQDDIVTSDEIDSELLLGPVAEPEGDVFGDVFAVGGYGEELDLDFGDVMDSQMDHFAEDVLLDDDTASTASENTVSHRSNVEPSSPGSPHQMTSHETIETLAISDQVEEQHSGDVSTKFESLTPDQAQDMVVSEATEPEVETMLHATNELPEDEAQQTAALAFEPQLDSSVDIEVKKQHAEVVSATEIDTMEQEGKSAEDAERQDQQEREVDGASLEPRSPIRQQVSDDQVDDTLEALTHVLQSSRFLRSADPSTADLSAMLTALRSRAESLNSLMRVADAGRIMELTGVKMMLREEMEELDEILEMNGVSNR
ncbi:hypothetical protein HKX48_007879 [Thoreauomyces humboldtii]|nr:hypothetical protein HKX48_007879 [Thoreauomyces humboldtii]